MISAPSMRESPEPPLLRRHVDGGHAERRRLADDVDGEVALLVPLGRVRGDALLGEGERRLLDGGLFLGEGEVHGAQVQSARWSDVLERDMRPSSSSM